MNAADYDKRTALHLVCSEGNEAVAVFLIEAGANIDAVDRWGFTPLDDAMRHKHTELADELVKRGASVGPKKLESISTDLCAASAVGDLDAVQALLMGLSKEDKAAAVNNSDYDLRTALHLAASEGYGKIVSFLIDDAGAETSPVDRWGGTPLDDAIRSDKQETAAILRERHARLGNTGTKASPRTRPSEIAVDLCNAAATGDLGSLRALMATGAGMNHGDYDKRTPLHLAASEGQLDVVRFLNEEAHTPMSPYDRWGSTPFDDAVRHSHKEVIAYVCCCFHDCRYLLVHHNCLLVGTSRPFRARAAALPLGPHAQPISWKAQPQAMLKSRPWRHSSTTALVAYRQYV